MVRDKNSRRDVSFFRFFFRAFVESRRCNERKTRGSNSIWFGLRRQTKQMISRAGEVWLSSICSSLLTISTFPSAFAPFKKYSSSAGIAFFSVFFWLSFLCECVCLSYHFFLPWRAQGILFDFLCCRSADWLPLLLLFMSSRCCCCCCCF